MNTASSIRLPRLSQARRLRGHRHLETFQPSSRATISSMLQFTLDTGFAGGWDAFNPAKFLLAVPSAWMIEGIERIVPFLKLRGMVPSRDSAIKMACTIAGLHSAERGWASL